MPNDFALILLQERQKEYDILRASIQDMRDVMLEASTHQRWSWDEIEAYLGGAMAVRGLDMDAIMEILRGPNYGRRRIW